MVKQVLQPTDVPQGHHFAILVFGQRFVHHEGDERSRTHPGHGYPEYKETIPTFEYWVAPTAADAQTKLEELYRRDHQRKDILFIEVVRPISVLPTIAVQFN